MNNAAAALAGAMAQICRQIVARECTSGLSYIDFNTIDVLVGMMVLMPSRQIKGYSSIAIKAAKMFMEVKWKE